jgi:folate-dependent tRNA-U54 methylase TrmFO/GidA
MGKEIVTGFVGALVTGVVIGLFPTNKYNIEGSKIKNRETPFGGLVEYKGEDKIKYLRDNNGSFKNGDFRVKINGEKYTKKDTLIYEEALKRYNYLNGKIDSINHARRESELQRKLEEEQKEVDEVLEVLRK